MDELIIEKLNIIEQKIIETRLFQKESLSFEEACIYVNRSASNMYKLTSQRRIPHYKDSKLIRFKRSELDAWLLRNPVKTLDEIESEAATRVALS